jgi:hypothetical protein
MYYRVSELKSGRSGGFEGGMYSMNGVIGRVAD